MNGNRPRAEVDLISMPDGATYEDRYNGYLAVFMQVARAPAEIEIVVKNPPWSWVPLLHYLGATLETPRLHFKHCDRVKGAFCAVVNEGRGSVPSIRALDRTDVEVLCSYRPECADALFKVDMQWKIDRRRIDDRYFSSDEFIVTTNGAYHRREVIGFMERVDRFIPYKKNVLLVPCAADKPFPAPLHEMCKALLPDDWYMATASGVVGIGPEELWSIMPHYDSGIPNEWRLYNDVKKYFSKHEHRNIVVFCDFYNIAISEALKAIGQDGRAEFVLPVQFYFDYQPLHKPHLQSELVKTIARIVDRER